MIKNNVSRETKYIFNEIGEKICDYSIKNGKNPIACAGEPELLREIKGFNAKQLTFQLKYSIMYM